MPPYAFPATATSKGRRFTFKKTTKLIGTVKCDGLPISTPGGWVAIDTETTGLDPWGTLGVDRTVAPARPFMFTLCNADGETACVRWQVNPHTREVTKDDASFAVLNKIFSDPSIDKVFHNAPYDYRMIRLSGFTIRGRIFDTIMGMHTVNPAEDTFKLKPLSLKYLGIEMDDQEDLCNSVKAVRRVVQSAKRAKEKGQDFDSYYADFSLSEEVEGDFFLGDEALCEKYGRTDAYRTAALWIAINEKLAEDDQLKTIFEKETKLGEVLRSMEDTGIRLDKDRTEDLIAFYNDVRDNARRTIVAEAGADFNPNSPKQMTKIFFGDRGFTPLQYSFNKQKKEFTKCQHCKGEGCNVCQGTGRNPKCDSEFLASIGVAHETDDSGNDILVEKDRLAYALLHESAADTMLQYINQYYAFKTFENGVWVVHPNYKQHGTRTSRLSAEKPNMQNVASDESGKKRVNVPYRARECFIPRDEFVYYIPDYSQIEVWILFLRAKAEKPLAALAAGGDAHQNIASLIWGDTYDLSIAKEAEKLKPEEITPEQKKHLKKHKQVRKRAKNLQFCKIYGGGPDKIAQMIGCPPEEAREFIAQYDERLPEVKQFMNETIRQAKRYGEIRNAYGRLYIIDRQFAYRATNYDIQGSAADLIKSAMINCYDLSQEAAYLGNLRMLLSIHDELLFEVHKSIDSEETMRRITEAMSRDYKFLGSPIPFPIGMKVAKTRWNESYEIKL